MVSGGSVTQRHMLSPVHFKLAQFLITFYSLKDQSVFVPVGWVWGASYIPAGMGTTNGGVPLRP